MKAPTDLELMMYFDGELEGERLAAVEAFLAKEKAPRAKLAALDLAADLVRESATAKRDAADGIADAVMAKLDDPAPKSERKVVRLPTRRERDSSRGVFVIAALVVAAAAAVFLWSRPSADDEAARRRRPPSVLVEAPQTGSTATTEAPKPDAPPADVVHGVEVAAVDFGSRTGAVFYVPSGTAASPETTTVVWLSDDDSAGGD